MKREQIEQLLQYGILAPSANNSQPWKYEIDGSTLTISPDYSRIRPDADPDNRELFISLGASLKNIKVAAAHFGYQSQHEFNHDQIVLNFSPKSSDISDSDLFPSLPLRVTNRGQYQDQSLTESQLKTINNLSYNHAFLKTYDTNNYKKEIAKLVYDADLIWFKNQELVKELEGWLRDDLEMAKDGIPTSVLSLYKVAIDIKYLFSGQSDYASNKAKNDSQQILSTPLVIVLATTHDQIIDWIEAGYLYETLALKLTQMNLSNSFYNVVIELKKFRQQLKNKLNLSGYPQLILRVGYAVSKPIKTSRRLLSDVISE